VVSNPGARGESDPDRDRDGERGTADDAGARSPSRPSGSDASKGDDRRTAPDERSEAPTDGSEDHRGAPPTPLTQQLGRVVLVVLAGLVVVFALANRHPVDFSWIIGETEVVEVAGERRSGGVPLIVLLLGSFVVGALVGALLEWQVLRRRRPPTGVAPERGRRHR
jgi:uncharacterized integral membrane protein